MSENDCPLVDSGDLSSETNEIDSSQTKTKKIGVQPAQLNNEVSADDQVSSQLASNEPTNNENSSSSSSSLSSERVVSTRESNVSGAGIKIQVNNQDYDESLESATKEDNSVEASSSSSENLFLQQNTNSSEIVRSVFSSAANKVSSPDTSAITVSSNPFSCVRNLTTSSSTSTSNEVEPQSQQRSSVIVTASRLFGNRPLSPSTSSTTARNFSSFSPRHDSNGSSEASNGEFLTKTKPFFLAKSRLESVTSNGFGQHNNEQSNNNLKIKLRPSVLKVGDSSSSESSSIVTTAQVLVGGEPSSSNKKPTSVMDVGLIKFTPLTNVATVKDMNTTTTGVRTQSAEVSTSNGSKDESSPQSPSSTINVASTTVPTSTNVGVGGNSSSFNTFAIASGSNANTAGADGFVFGQNLEERVTNVSKDDDKTQEKMATVDSTIPVITEKRKYENITGEEGEENVKQIFCKLFQWDSATSGWKEKGKGNLRLNDKTVDSKCSSRLIMRTSGSLKLILNCMIVHGMKFEQSNDTLRFSTVEGVHIIRGKAKEIEELKVAVDGRLRNLPKRVRAVDDEDDDENDDEGHEEADDGHNEIMSSVSVETIDSTQVQN